MVRATSIVPRRAGNRVWTQGPDRVAFSTATVLAALTVAFVALPDLRFAVYAPQLDIALTTLATIVSAAVAMLAFARFREQGGPTGLLEASAFTILALANFANVLAILLGIDASLGLTLQDPGQLPLYWWSLARLLSSGLLLAGALGPGPRTAVFAAHARAVVILPSLLLTGACVALWLVRDQMPVLVGTDVLRQLANETFSSAPLPGVNLGILVLDGSAAGLLFAAAIVYARRHGTDGVVPRNYLVAGLTIAAFSQIHFILYPAVYSGLVSTGDGLRILFYLVLAAGVQAGARDDLHALRRANARLQVLASAEADRTAMAERARLARELHDGLAQDLWTAKLEIDRVGSALPGDEAANAALLAPARRALDAALREARNAVETLHSGFDAGLAFGDELPRRLDAFAERTGYPIDLELDPRAARVPGVVAAEILRIVDEALNNIHKHADATRIRVRAAIRDDMLVVSVEDNGRGFNPSLTKPGHGLTGMRERAVLLDASLVIHSAPGDGTSVQLLVPAAEIAP